MGDTRDMPLGTFRQLLHDIETLGLSRRPPLHLGKDHSSGGVEDDLVRVKEARERQLELDREQAALDPAGMANRITLGLSIQGSTSHSPFDQGSSVIHQESLQAAKMRESEFKSHIEATKASQDRLRQDREMRNERQASLVGVYSLTKDKLQEREVMKARQREEERQRLEHEERRKVEAKDKAAREMAEEAARLAKAAVKPPVKPAPPPKHKPQVDEIVLLDSSDDEEVRRVALGRAANSIYGTANCPHSRINSRSILPEAAQMCLHGCSFLQSAIETPHSQ